MRRFFHNSCRLDAIGCPNVPSREAVEKMALPKSAGAHCLVAKRLIRECSRLDSGRIVADPYTDVAAETLSEMRVYVKVWLAPKAVSGRHKFERSAHSGNGTVNLVARTDN